MENNLYNALFTGQGSQFADMFDPFIDMGQSREILERASEVLGYDILKVSHDEEKIFKTHYSQPLNYVYEYMLFQMLKEETSYKPNVVVGHSMGEFAALACMGAVDFDTGLNLIKLRGELMTHVNAEFLMVSVIGISSVEVEMLVESYNAAKERDVNISNYNGSSQTIVTIQKDDFENFENYVTMLYDNAIVKKLKLPYPFHTKHMKKYSVKLAEYMDKLVLHKMVVPMISNVTGRPCKDIYLKKYLVEQMYMPIHFSDCMNYAYLTGVNNWVEFGPGSVLGKIVKREYPDAQVFSANKEVGRADSDFKNKKVEKETDSLKKQIEHYLYYITTYADKEGCTEYQDITKNYNLLRKLYLSQDIASAGKKDAKQEEYVRRLFMDTMKLKGYKVQTLDSMDYLNIKFG
ncbi:polyketide biosynthesis malonyl-CoA-[acyl-carrier-protein] transacylase [Ruminiclostridium sufflavum DSM 19573]|uniref:[acyl-carrier-protein] S-malonyltransferase n=1 Tax=Ruminiclostridium sufflavum DSM 19573 TaxID=1121337 RepID=A0A318XMR0_9FIRM|nr:ACP S-malonyltransferase [Ruminiclostridium sufflavum]PYG88036.1 polyketide biosynthesis malonyl-CoA-[acyl-carrier-protein] transacylase [Ruminiclostridium sufflavum DSM 19573]